LQVSDTDAVLDGTMDWEPEPLELTGLQGIPHA
jgi:hypothetical protein